MLSPAGLLLVRPFRGYSELAEDRNDSPTVVGGVVRLAFVVGAVVAITSAGRLAPVEHLVASGSFAWVPLVQLVALAVALRVTARDVPIRRAFALHLAGQGPAMVVLLAIAALALVVPADATARVLLRAVPSLLAAALVWGGVLRYACFRRGLGLSPRRALAATALYTFVIVGIVVGYFLAMGQLQPLLA